MVPICGGSGGWKRWLRVGASRGCWWWFGYVVGMEAGLVDAAGGGFGYAMEMAVELVEAAGVGFGYAVELVVELHALAGEGCPGCIASL
jgi:hypothetical protein